MYWKCDFFVSVYQYNCVPLLSYYSDVLLSIHLSYATYITWPTNKSGWHEFVKEWEDARCAFLCHETNRFLQNNEGGRRSRDKGRAGWICRHWWYSPADMWMNCAFRDTSMKSGIYVEHIITNVFEYRAISHFALEAVDGHFPRWPP